MPGVEPGDSSSRAAARVGSPSATSSSSASASSTCPSVSAPVPVMVRSNGRRRPSHVTYRPAFSAAGATGRTTSACSVTALRRTSRLTMKPAVLQARVGKRRVGEVGGIDAADDECRERTVGGGTHDRVGVAAGCVGHCAPQTPRDVARARASVTERAPGSSVGSAPASSAPRSPARRGTQASLRAGTRGEGRDGRERAGDGSQPLADEDHAHRAGTAPSSRCRRAGRARPPRPRGRSGCSVPSSLCSPASANGATEHTGRAPCAPPCAAAGRRSATLLRARSRRAERRAPSPATRRTRAAGSCPATCAARKRSSSALRRTGAEVDVVRAECDARELRVRVGVLFGEPTAWKHADAAAVDGLAQARSRHARAQPASWSRRAGPARCGRAGR